MNDQSLSTNIQFTNEVIKKNQKDSQQGLRNQKLRSWLASVIIFVVYFYQVFNGQTWYLGYLFEIRLVSIPIGFNGYMFDLGIDVIFVIYILFVSILSFILASFLGGIIAGNEYFNALKRVLITLFGFLVILSIIEISTNSSVITTGTELRRLEYLYTVLFIGLVFIYSGCGIIAGFLGFKLQGVIIARYSKEKDVLIGKEKIVPSTSLFDKIKVKCDVHQLSSEALALITMSLVYGVNIISLIFFSKWYYFLDVLLGLCAGYIASKKFIKIIIIFTSITFLIDIIVFMPELLQTENENELMLFPAYLTGYYLAHLILRYLGGFAGSLYVKKLTQKEVSPTI